MPKRGRVKAICKDCGEEIFGDRRMVMLKDNLWKKVCDVFEDYICDLCIEKRMGREIKKSDLKMWHEDSRKEMIPCNAFWLFLKEKDKKTLKNK